MRVSFIKCHGSGNDFPLVDAARLEVGEEAWPALARALADRSGPVGGDGLLVLTGEQDNCAFGMRMFNPDGSEAETCLNGLRCTARLGFERTGGEAAMAALRTSTADVRREPELAPGVVTIRTRVGPVDTRAASVGLRIAAGAVLDETIDGLPHPGRFTAVAMPNPHLVHFVDRVDEAELVALGDWCEAAPALIPARANVSFVEVRGSDAEPALFVRTYERGVGLTDSCGSAMAASSWAAAATGRVPLARDIRVFNRGGMVVARVEADGHVAIAGNATFEWDGSVAFDGHAASDLRIERLRHDEVAAWDALRGAL